MKHRINSNLLMLFICALTLFTAMTGCAQNKQPVAQIGSMPNEYSAYLFSVGNVLYYNNDLDGADVAYRMALRYDPNAVSIKKALFTAMLYQTARNEITPQTFGNLVDTLLTQNIMDKQMLEQTFDVFVKTESNLEAKAILDIYFKSYSSARAYSSLFYLEQALYKKSRPALLDKAFKLAGNDAQFLNSLGYIYQVYGSDKAERTWLQARKFDTSTESSKYLWQLYSKQNNTQKLHKLWASYSYPEEEDKLYELTNYAFENADFNSIILLSDVILTTDNPKFILTLLQSCWYANNNPLFNISWNQLQTLDLSKSDLQLSYFYVALHNLRNGNYPAALAMISNLNGKSSLDELVGIYRASSLMGTAVTDTTQIEIIKNKLRQAINPATSQQMAQPVKTYLLAVTDSLKTDNEFNQPDSVTLPCVEWFYNNNRRTYDTYFWLAQFYNRDKQDLQQKAMLREALEEYPNDAALLNWLGYSYVLTGDNFEEAEIFIRRALQLAPDNPFYLDSLGWLYYLKGDFKQALELMDIPSRLEKMPAEIAWHLGSIYQALNDKDKAIQYLKLAIEINDDAETAAKAKVQLGAIGE